MTGRNRARVRAIRARMAVTGENYTRAARAHDAEQAARHETTNIGHITHRPRAAARFETT